jgi:hypothetical protein
MCPACETILVQRASGWLVGSFLVIPAAICIGLVAAGHHHGWAAAGASWMFVGPLVISTVHRKLFQGEKRRLSRRRRKRLSDGRAEP